MTLTEFLLARIADDEVVTRLVDGSPDFTPQPFTAARVLADCESKRRIVERHRDCGTGHGYCDDGGHGWEEGLLGCADLADLALSYDLHPDYQEEWRV